MAVDDLWTKRGPAGGPKRVPSKRAGRGKRWRVRWTDPDGKPCVELFTKQSDAQRHDASTHNDINRGRYVDPHGGTVTLADYKRPVACPAAPPP